VHGWMVSQVNFEPLGLCDPYPVDIVCLRSGEPCKANKVKCMRENKNGEGACSEGTECRVALADGPKFCPENKMFLSCRDVLDHSTIR
jgi:hypothetical protein